VQSEATNEANRCLAVLEDLVVQRYEKGADIFRLSEMLVELFMQICQNSLPNCCV
jgi:hypothetical protein